MGMFQRELFIRWHGCYTFFHTESSKTYSTGTIIGPFTGEEMRLTKSIKL